MPTIPTTATRDQVFPMINLDGRFAEADLTKHHFASDPALTLNTAFDEDDNTLNEAWAIGNRMEYDPATKEFWPRWCRSLSVGDLILIARVGQPVRAYAIDSVGFREVPFTEPQIDWDADRATLAAHGHAGYRG